MAVAGAKASYVHFVFQSLSGWIKAVFFYHVYLYLHHYSETLQQAKDLIKAMKENKVKLFTQIRRLNPQFVFQVVYSYVMGICYSGHKFWKWLETCDDIYWRQRPLWILYRPSESYFPQKLYISFCGMAVKSIFAYYFQNNLSPKNYSQSLMLTLDMLFTEVRNKIKQFIVICFHHK